MSVKSLMKLSDLLAKHVTNTKAECIQTQHTLSENFHSWFGLELNQFCQKWGVELEYCESELHVKVPYRDVISKNETCLSMELCYFLNREKAGESRVKRSAATQRFIMDNTQQSPQWREFEQELISLYSIKLDFEQRVKG